MKLRKNSLVLIIFTLVTTITIQLAEAKMKIVAIEDFSDPKQCVLKQKANEVSFPLQSDDRTLIEEMKGMIFDFGGVGLAAPQVGVSKNIAVIYIPESAALLRDNVIPVAMHVMINATYKPVKQEEVYQDFEGCYSVKNIMGKVPRYNSIEVTYYNEDGKKTVQTLSGFYARVAQHEIDHLNGLLITDRLTQDCLQGTPQEMLKIRRDELPEEKKILFDKLIEQKNLQKKE